MSNEPRKFVITPARRQGIKPLIGCYGMSGGGKTRSALILARGMVGPKGKIRVLDTENGRSRMFADKIPGGYDVIDLAPPFTPDLYADALAFAQKDSDIVLIDSMSHEWEGEGGVLEMQEAELDRMAGDNWQKREQCKFTAWIKPKFAHKHMMQLVLRYPVPIIVCLRGQKKVHMGKDAKGKTEVWTDDFTTPIADPRFIFEMLINLELYEREGRGGYCHVRKITNEDLFACLPRPSTEQQLGEQVTYEHGAKLMAWCSNPDGGVTSAASTAAPTAGAKDERTRLLTEIRDATTTIHHWKRADGAAAWPAAKELMVRWLVDECGITTLLDAQTVDELANTLAAAKRKLTNQPEGKLL